MDSKDVVDTINSSILDISEFWSIIRDCKNIVVESASFSVRFAKR